MTTFQLLKLILKRMFCVHEYEFRNSGYVVRNSKLVPYETYQCTKCDKRKETRVR